MDRSSSWPSCVNGTPWSLSYLDLCWILLHYPWSSSGNFDRDISLFLNPLSLQDGPCTPSNTTVCIKNTFDASMWWAWGCWFDAGTGPAVPTWTEQRVRTLTGLFSFTGFLYHSVVLGIICDWTRSLLTKFETKYKRVLDNDHVVVLGWSVKVCFMLILSQHHELRK